MTTFTTHVAGAKPTDDGSTAAERSLLACGSLGGKVTVYDVKELLQAAEARMAVSTGAVDLQSSLARNPQTTTLVIIPNCHTVKLSRTVRRRAARGDQADR
jgi:hypothetical protein